MFAKDKAPIATILMILFLVSLMSAIQTENLLSRVAHRGFVSHNVNLRRDPSIDRSPIVMLHVADSVLKLGPCKKGFCKVKTNFGVIGWVWKKNIVDESLMLAKRWHGITEGACEENLCALEHELIHDSFSAYLDTSQLNQRGLVQSLLDSLPTSNLIFTHPEEMRLGEEKTVKVVIDPDLKKDIQVLRKRFEYLGQVDVELVKISTTMKSVLRGEHFKITPLTSEEQLISEKDSTEWSFVVVPQEEGKQKLHLTVSVVVKLSDGQEKTRDFPAKEETINVTVSPFVRVASFAEAEWHWILTTLAIPLGLWILNKWRGGKRKHVGFADSK